MLGQREEAGGLLEERTLEVGRVGPLPGRGQWMVVGTRVQRVA
jgi:hypothetical protein